MSATLETVARKKDGPELTAEQQLAEDLVTRSLDPTGTGRTRWTMRWKAALNAFAITFGDRFPAAETYYVTESPETPLTTAALGQLASVARYTCIR